MKSHRSHKASRQTKPCSADSQDQPTINVAIAGLGNCASSLIQGVSHYAALDQRELQKHIGLMHYDIGGYRPQHIRFVAAFDIDKRKVGLPITQAIFAQPNCTAHICTNIPAQPGTVHMGNPLDGISPHTLTYDQSRRILPSSKEPANIAEVLREANAHILVCYTPVGADKAALYYAQAALNSNIAFINCVPVFIASNQKWSNAFRKKSLPLIGDDIKSQIGATIIHRTLVRLFETRGATINRTYQLNVGGNTDFLNMLDTERLTSKKISKTESVQSQLKTPLHKENIHIGPSDYVPFLNDNKICFIRIEATGFGNIPLTLEARLSVEDSPNSAGIVIDAIRCAKLAMDAGIGGTIDGPSAYFMKHPPVQYTDEEARHLTENFIKKTQPRQQKTKHKEGLACAGSSRYIHLR